jgi:hypothetical protein
LPLHVPASFQLDLGTLLKKKAVDKAIGELHQRLNAQEYKQIYDDTHHSFKSSQTEPKFIDQMKKVRETLGEVKYVTDKWINVIVGPSIEIRAMYNSTFDKGDASEFFIFVREGENISLYRYQVSPGTAPPGDPSWRYTDGTINGGVNNPK